MQDQTISQCKRLSLTGQVTARRHRACRTKEALFAQYKHQTPNQPAIHLEITSPQVPLLRRLWKYDLVLQEIVHFRINIDTLSLPCPPLQPSQS